MKWLAKIGSLLVGIGLVVYLVVALAFTSDQMDGQRVSSISVDIRNLDEVDFVDDEMVIQSLVDRHIKITNQPIDSINKSYVKEVVQDIPYIRQAEVFFTPDGVFHLKVWQRIPVLRVMRATKSYYVDEAGSIFPVSERFSAKVPVFTGKINQELLQQDLIDMALFILNDEFWQAMVGQVQVWSDREVEIVPTIGSYRIFIGKPDELGWKFEKLRTLFEKALPVVGWDAYSSIDLRYSNQVVCQRKE